MSQAYMSPDHFVHWATIEGFATKGGNIRLNKYMSASDSNGGSYTSQDLMNQLKGVMTRLGSTPPFRNYVRMFTGQGDINDFITLWNWMYDHLDEMRKLKIQTYSVRNNGDGTFTKIPGKLLDLATVFKPSRPFPEAMAELVDNACFGWDCIGFVSQYLVTISHLDQYQTWKSDQYLTLGKFDPIKTLEDILPCCVIVFGDWHIVLVDGVDWIAYDDNTKTLSAKVSVSQSYTGGPHTRRDKILTQTRFGNGWSEVNQTGVLDVAAKCRVGKNAAIEIRFPPYVAAD
jgi:hypothetical protein